MKAKMEAELDGFWGLFFIIESIALLNDVAGEKKNEIIADKEKQ